MTKAPWVWDKKRPENWTVDAQVLQKTYFFGQLYTYRAHNSEKTINFDVIEGKDVVQCIAVTKQKELVLVSQFRPGCKDLSLEIPGGAIEKQEDPIHALHRELREESGYTGENPILLCQGYFNPALMKSHIYYYLLSHCEKTCDTDFDPSEDCATYLLPCEQLEATLMKGIFQSMVTVTGLALLQNWFYQHPTFLNR
ncbi:MAG: NUDIX hydrolase [Opitutales bacterium]|nr:NUDIX hydrolase [Opitutales bacterium]